MTGSSTTGPFRHAGHVRMRPDVRRVQRPAGLLLVSPDRDPVMVSRLVEEMWESLVAGVDVPELARLLRARRPAAQDVEAKLDAFLDRLWRAGLLEGGPASAMPRRGVQIPVDVLADRLAAPWRRLPRRAAAAALLAAGGLSAAGLAVLLTRPDRPRLTTLPTRLGPLALPGVAALALLHEIGHAVACRAIGVPSGPLTVQLGRLGIPRLTVHTPQVLGVREAVRRVWVPAGGPFVDLLAGGLAAWALVVRGEDRTGSVAPLVALYALISLDVGTSPLLAGDGSHVVESILDDDFARSAALLGRWSRFARRRNVWLYRLACVLHVAGSAALVRRLW